MLSEPPASSGDLGAIESRVRDLVAETAGAEAAAPLLGAPLDSLTLFAIVARIEAAFAVAFDGGETAALLGARDLGELARLIADKVAERRANLGETPGNES